MAIVHLSAAIAVLAFPVDGEEFFQGENASRSDAVSAVGATEGYVVSKVLTNCKTQWREEPLV